MENKKQSLLRTNNATYKNVDGVTYFKLRSEFSGDYTKNCGLLGEEIDENFYFLRGYDIESIYVDSDRNLIIERVDKDYDPIKVKIGEELGKDTFRFDKETGTIYITYPDGTVAKMDGFLVAGKDIKMATDSTISGDGTIFNPLRISPVDITGTYGPADEYFDITESKIMPEGKGKGYRIVTKEKIDNFGCLYSLDEMKRIQSELENEMSQWRVPTKQDWDELLNAMEVNPEYRNHSSKSNKWLGQVAGSALKSVNLWREFDAIKKEEMSVKGQDVVGMSILPLGIGPDRNEVLNEEDFDLEGFEKLGGFWTNTEDGTGNNYVKLFAYNSAQVDQDTYGEGAKLSVRLVKEYNYDNYNEVEEILGLPYTTKLVYGICEDMPYVKIWTDINVYLYSPNFGVRSEEWNVVTDSDRGVKTVYFINEWDGLKWHKKLMNEAYSVVIKKYEDKPNHEWRVINGELIDTLDDIMNAFSDTINELNQKIKDEAENREKGDLELNEKIEKEISDRKSEITLVKDAIEKESEERKTEDNHINTALIKETNDRIRGDKELDERFKNEVSRLDKDIAIEKEEREKVDNSLSNRIDEEEKARIEGDKELDKKVELEIETRIKEDEKLKELIFSEDEKIRESLSAETAERIESDEKLAELISEEEKNRKEEDNKIREALEKEIVDRINNDIKPGNYTLEGDSEKEMTLPTFGEEVADITIKVSSDFFNFGKIINNE